MKRRKVEKSKSPTEEPSREKAQKAQRGSRFAPLVLLGGLLGALLCPPAAASLMNDYGFPWDDPTESSLRTTWGIGNYSPEEYFDNTGTQGETTFYTGGAYDLSEANAPYGEYEEPWSLLVVEYKSSLGPTPVVFAVDTPWELEMIAYEGAPYYRWRSWEWVGTETIDDGWRRNVWEVTAVIDGGIREAATHNSWVVESHRGMHMRWTAQMVNVPEPSVAALLALGACAVLRRKRRNVQKSKRRNPTATNGVS